MAVGVAVEGDLHSGDHALEVDEIVALVAGSAAGVGRDVGLAERVLLGAGLAGVEVVAAEAFLALSAGLGGLAVGVLRVGAAFGYDAGEAGQSVALVAGSAGSGVGVVGLAEEVDLGAQSPVCLLYTSPSPRDLSTSRMPSSA